MKKVLITNASSSLGINLAHLLLKDENIFIYAYDKQLSKNTPSLFTLLRNDRYSFIEHDLISPIECVCEETYHLSPCLNKTEFLNDKYFYITRELHILDNILKYCSITGSKLIFVNNFLDYKENSKDYFPYYDAVKSMHSLIKEYSIKEKIYYKIAQISDYYGINSIPTSDNFVGDYIMKAFNNEPITIDKDEYLYLTNVSDIVRALKQIMENYSDCDIIDVTNPNTALKSDVLRLILSFIKSDSKVKINAAIPDKPKYLPDVSILNNSLNIRCGKTLLDGMPETIDFYKLMYLS